MYRILTESKNVDAVKALLGSLGFDYTVYYCDGSWHGQMESSMVIELGNASENDAHALAQLIKQTNAQQAVLVQNIPATSHLI